VIDRLRSIPGVEAVALADWPLLNATGRGGYISIEGGRQFKDPAYFLDVSPGWMHVMRIPFIAGRDFRVRDVYPKVAIVNEAFAKQFFDGANAPGKSFTTTIEGEQAHLEIVGLVRNARYGALREPTLPVAYFPFRSIGTKSAGTFVVRTFNTNPLVLANVLRQEIFRADPELRITNIRTQEQINATQTIRERLIAMLALFFSGVALLLAAIGLYGVLNHAVLQRRREIAIRIAVGARAGQIGRLMTVDIVSTVVVGALAGLGLGMTLARYIESLLYQVKATDVSMLALPVPAIFLATSLAALPPLIRAMRIDPVNVLRME
jgi:ABC-type antimicrobial peptide transport system permease subunit